MRLQFRGYFEPTSEELSQVWLRGTIVLDANVLLNLYRYSENTRSQLLETLESISAQLWLPHQVGLEYLRNRVKVIDAQAKAYELLKKKLDTAVNGFTNELGSYRYHPVLQVSRIQNELNEARHRIQEIISQAQAVHADVSAAGLKHDPVRDRLDRIFEGRVGDPFSDEDLAALHKEGKERYDAEIPPGFADKDKAEPERYGDLVLWKQLLTKARDASSHVIFVTDDTKKNWWNIYNGITLGPRPELVEEFVRHAGNEIVFYRPEQFVAEAKNRISSTITQESISEIQEISVEQEFVERRIENARGRRAELARDEARVRNEIVALESRVESIRDRLRTVDRLREELQENHSKLRALQTQEEGRRSSSAVAALRSRRDEMMSELRTLEADEAHLMQLRERLTEAQARLGEMQMEGEYLTHQVHQFERGVAVMLGEQ